MHLLPNSKKCYKFEIKFSLRTACTHEARILFKRKNLKRIDGTIADD